MLAPPLLLTAPSGLGKTTTNGEIPKLILSLNPLQAYSAQNVAKIVGGARLGRDMMPSVPVAGYSGGHTARYPVTGGGVGVEKSPVTLATAGEIS